MSEKPNWQTVIIRGAHHVVTDCGKCGVTYTVPRAMYDSMWRNSGFAHCPNGHQRGYPIGNVEQEDLRRERDRLKQRVAQLNDSVKEAADRAEKTAAELTRHKKRASAGTCPCCNRTFQNMSIHMRKQHPEYVKSNVVALKSA